MDLSMKLTIETPDFATLRDRAYDIWRREGYPEGRDRHHWTQAWWECLGEAAWQAWNAQRRAMRQETAMQDTTRPL